MFPIGFFLVLAGAWLADSAFHGRPPLTTLKDILQNPGDIGTILDDRKGTTPSISASVAAVTAPLHNPRGKYVTGADLAGADRMSSIIAYMERQIGKPYGWGKAGPKAYDCSGLGYAAYRSVGISIPRTTAGMLATGIPVRRKNLQPGDAIFPYPGHVFWYIGGGKCIEAPHTGTVIHYTNIYQFMTARRFVKS